MTATIAQPGIGRGRHPASVDAFTNRVNSRRAERVAGLAFARRYRETQPFRARLDAFYGLTTSAVAASYPFRDHRTCAEWTPADAEAEPRAIARRR